MQLTSAFLGSKLVCRTAPAVQVSKDAPRQVTCMAKKKGVRCIVTLECTEAKGEGATPSRYTTQKVKHTRLDSFIGAHSPLLVLDKLFLLQNRKNTTGRMELKKYNKYLKRHTVHKEIK